MKTNEQIQYDLEKACFMNFIDSPEQLVCDLLEACVEEIGKNDNNYEGEYTNEDFISIMKLVETSEIKSIINKYGATHENCYETIFKNQDASSEILDYANTLYLEHLEG